MSTYIVKLECLNRGKLVRYPQDEIELDFIPRENDSILVQDTYYDIKSVMLNSSKAREVTIYVNSIGDMEAFHRFLKAKKSLIDVNPAPISAPDIKFF